MVWTTGVGWPWRASEDWSWSKHPGLPVATTSRIQRNNQLGFAIAQRVGSVRLNEIVDPRRAAADGSFWDFRELEARNISEQLARLRAHTLGMLQVAGIVERHAQAQEDFLQRAAEARMRTSVMSLHFAAKALARSAYFGSSRSKWPYSFTLEPQPAAFVTMVSTFACSNASMVFLASARAPSSSPCVNHQSAAAWLVLWRDDFATFGGKDARRGCIHLREKFALHAAEQQADTAALCALAPA